MDQFNVNGNYTEQDIKDILESKISRYFGVRPEEATKTQVYKAVILTVKDMLTEKRSAFRRLMKRDCAKRVYYMWMLFFSAKFASVPYCARWSAMMFCKDAETRKYCWLRRRILPSMWSSEG